VLIIDRRTHQIVTIVPSGNTGSQPSAPGDYWRR
jgi:hypothetical protein